jgi:hypothetical protein
VQQLHGGKGNSFGKFWTAQGINHCQNEEELRRQQWHKEQGSTQQLHLRKEMTASNGI